MKIKFNPKNWGDLQQLGTVWLFSTVMGVATLAGVLILALPLIPFAALGFYGMFLAFGAGMTFKVYLLGCLGWCVAAPLAYVAGDPEDDVTEQTAIRMNWIAWPLALLSIATNGRLSARPLLEWVNKTFSK